MDIRNNKIHHEQNGQQRVNKNNKDVFSNEDRRMSGSLKTEVAGESL